MPDDRKNSWEERYDAGRTAWDRGASSPALEEWLHDIPKGRVLVPGCGNGHEVEALLAAGMKVTAVDIASQPVASLRARLAARGVDEARARVIQADLLSWNPAEAFDAIYEQTCLCALDPSDRQGYEEQLHAWLRPGARLFALFMQTGRDGGPPYDCSVDDMRELFADARWCWLSEAPLHVPHPTGLEELGFVLERKPSRSPPGFEDEPYLYP